MYTKRITIGDIAANGTKTTNTDITIDGLSALGVVGWANIGASGFYPYQLDLSGNTLNCFVRNTSNSAISGASIQVMVLYQKYHD